MAKDTAGMSAKAALAWLEKASRTEEELGALLGLEEGRAGGARKTVVAALASLIDEARKPVLEEPAISTKVEKEEDAEGTLLDALEEGAVVAVEDDGEPTPIEDLAPDPEPEPLTSIALADVGFEDVPEVVTVPAEAARPEPGEVVYVTDAGGMVHEALAVREEPGLVVTLRDGRETKGFFQEGTGPGTWRRP